MKDKRIQHIYELIFLKLIIFFVRLLDFEMTKVAGNLFGLFLFYCLPIRKKTAIRNIRKSLGTKSGEAIKITKKMYKNFGRSLFEFMNIEKLDRKNISPLAEFQNIETLEKAISENKGVIFCTVHLGNWHFMGYALKRRGIVVNHILKKQKNEKVFEILKNTISGLGMKYLILQKVPKNIFRALRNGDVVEFLCDQDAGKTGIFANFFGRPASTAQGPALFHKSVKAPIVLAYCVREGRKYKILFRIYENPRESAEKIVADYTKYFENTIRKYPDQYFWLHKRWHTKPHNR
ncbi:MAG: lysophospholipid acyltransferase family protein [Elusimicrobia bacterium]|nr:lysophospholipid acyltransferase family protein [Elusimicrobiota bacterium]